MKSRWASQALAEELRPGVQSGDASLAGFELGASGADRRSVTGAASATVRSGSNSAPKSGYTSLAGFEPAASGVAGDSPAEPVTVGARSGAEFAPKPPGFAELVGSTGAPRPPTALRPQTDAGRPDIPASGLPANASFLLDAPQRPAQST